MFSVSDLETSVEIYTSIFRFRIRERGEGTGLGLQQLWNLPRDLKLEWVLLERAEDVSAIKIRLVKFTPAAPRARYPYRYQDCGYTDVHFCAYNVPDDYKVLVNAGFLGLHEPVLWRGGGGELGVGEKAWYETFLVGPDGEGVTLMPSAPEGPTGEFAARVPVATDSFSPIQEVVLSVSSLQEAYTFYHHILGWNELGRWEAFGPLMEDMLRIPPGTVARPIFFRYPSNPDGPGIIVIDFAGCAKIDLYARNAPPQRGFVVQTFHTYDVTGLYRETVAAGCRIVHSPIEISEPPYSGSKAFSVRGPDGVFVEFIEQKNS